LNLESNSNIETMSAIEKKLAALKLELKNAKPPVGNYIGCKSSGELLFASGRVSELAGEIGSDVNEEQAKQATLDTVLLILAIIKENIHDLDLLTGVVKMQGFFRCASNFTKQPEILDAASDLLIELFGENGRHARTATGVAQLPFGAAVQLDIIFQIKKVN